MPIDLESPAMHLVLSDDATEIDLEALQGLWTEEQYLRLSELTARPIEFTDGIIDVLPMPTDHHQAISMLLIQILLPLAQRRGGALRHTGLRLSVRPGKQRDPDLVLLLNRADPRRQQDYWRGADLVVEIVSLDAPARDRQGKRVDYAEAGIPEYWIVDPLTDTITVLTLAGAEYVEHGIFRRGDTATSVLLPECAVRVSTVLDAE